jgi:hypothetical protein
MVSVLLPIVLLTAFTSVNGGLSRKAWENSADARLYERTGRQPPVVSPKYPKGYQSGQRWLGFDHPVDLDSGLSQDELKKTYDFFATPSDPKTLLAYKGAVKHNAVPLQLLDKALNHLNAEPVPHSKVEAFYKFARDNQAFPNVTTDKDFAQSGDCITKIDKPTQGPGTHRRLPWLYVPDGCYMRAEFMVDWASEVLALGPRTIHKVFLFGNSLKVSSKFAEGGQLRWVYHVAPLMKSDKTGYVVVDPSLDSAKPLPLKDWIALMPSTSGERSFALTNKYAFWPSSDCDAKHSLFDIQNSYNDLEEFLKSRGLVENFLVREWEAVRQLGQNPEKVLGECPPWVSC